MSYRTLVLLATATALHAQPQSEPATAADVISRHVAALGGESALRSVKHRRTVMTTEFRMSGMASSTTVESFYSAPDRVLTKSAIMGMATESGFDGTIGWTKTGTVAAEQVTGERLAMIRGAAPTVPDWSKARDLKYIGRRELDGRAMHAITWMSDDHGEIVEYFDAVTGLKRANEQVAPMPGGARKVLLLYDHGVKDGYTLVTRMDMRSGADTMWTARITVVDHSPIDPKIYAAPAELQGRKP